METMLDHAATHRAVLRTAARQGWEANDEDEDAGTIKK